MRKYVSFILALALLLMPSIVQAASSTERVLVYVIPNTSSVGIVTNVSTSTFIPGKHRLVAWEVSPTVSGSGNSGMSIYDTTLLTLANIGTYDTATYMKGETQSANTESAFRSAPLGGVTVASQLSVYQGAGSIVTLYYERYTP